jgi:diguanylate cyclase (GGDEF)-like protein
LVAVADSLRSGLRTYDFAARYGGEEFVLILPETSHEGAMLVAERLRESVQSLDYSGALNGLKTTVSMGVATFPHDSITAIPALIKEADNAMYRAKASGRNRVLAMNRKESAALFC